MSWTGKWTPDWVLRPGERWCRSMGWWPGVLGWSMVSMAEGKAVWQGTGEDTHRKGWHRDCESGCLAQIQACPGFPLDLGQIR